MQGGSTMAALTNEETRIGELGAQLAQAHYALTTDHEGPLPMRPTDADRQKLSDLLGRAYGTEEEQRFEAGYREAYLRLVGNGGPMDEAQKGFDPVLHAELFALVSKYGVEIPPEGSPEREKARLLITKSVNELRDGIAKLLPQPVEERTQRDKSADAAGVSSVEGAPPVDSARSVD